MTERNDRILANSRKISDLLSQVNELTAEMKTTDGAGLRICLDGTWIDVREHIALQFVLPDVVEAT